LLPDTSRFSGGYLRSLARVCGGLADSALYGGLIAAIHFLFFITLVRLYSASTDRDALFLSMLSFAAVLASAVLTVDTTFLILFFVYLLFAVAAFASIELRRGAADALASANSKSK